MLTFRSGDSILRVLIVLAITQVIGWGTISLPAVIGRQVAGDLRMDLSAVFAGSSILYVSMGLWSPLLAKTFTQHGARRVMMGGTLVAVPGFVMLALANGPGSYFAAWALLGAAGSATLSTASYIMLNEIAGRGARSAIGALMLVTGLSSSIFWPITAFLSDIIGWRGVCFAYAALMLLVCFPLYGVGLPRRALVGRTIVSRVAAEATSERAVSRTMFYLIVVAIALSAFVTYGISSVLIELLKASGLPAAQAILFGSLLGVIQVCARGIDFVGGGRWDGITTGLFAAVALPAAMVVLMVGAGTYWAIACFIIVYGLGSGALAVARATIPLVFYDQADYARAASHIALPLNVIAAAAPPLLIETLTQFGSRALLGLTTLCSCTALMVLVILARRRPSAGLLSVN